MYVNNTNNNSSLKRKFDSKEGEESNRIRRKTVTFAEKNLYCTFNGDDIPMKIFLGVNVPQSSNKRKHDEVEKK
ncbi:unnamed protein product [Cunninghamella blakesleeana]